MLMYGSVKGSRWLILPWLVATFLFILAYIAGMILSTILFGVTLLSIAFLAIAIIEVSHAKRYLYSSEKSLSYKKEQNQLESQNFPPNPSKIGKKTLPK